MVEKLCSGYNIDCNTSPFLNFKLGNLFLEYFIISSDLSTPSALNPDLFNRFTCCPVPEPISNTLFTEFIFINLLISPTSKSFYTLSKINSS